MKYKKYIGKNIDDVLKKLKTKDFKIEYKYSLKKKDTILDVSEKDDFIIFEVSKSIFIFIIIIVLLLIISLIALNLTSNNNEKTSTKDDKEKIVEKEKEPINKIEPINPIPEENNTNNKPSTNTNTNNKTENTNNNTNTNNDNDLNTEDKKETIEETPKQEETIKEHSIKYIIDNKEYRTDKVEENKKTNKIEPLTIEGYTFLGWYLNDTKFDFNTKITEDIELVAKYEINKYIVTFKDNGKPYDTQEITYNEKVSKPTEPSKKNYIFKGWYLNDELFDFESNITKEIVLESKYEIIKYSISYSDEIKSFADSNNPTEVDATSTAEITFNGLKGGNIIAIINGTSINSGEIYTYDNGEKSKYTFENGVVKISNVNSDISFEKRDYVKVNLSNDSVIQNYEDKASIESVEFKDYIDLSKTDKYWDITTDQSKLAYAWLEGNDLYIGFDLILKSDSLDKAFYGMTNVESINFNNRLDTSEVTNMRGLFYNCSSLKEIDVSSFNTSNVTNMYGMFYNTPLITDIDISNFDTSKVTNMGYMFYGMEGLNSLDVSNFDTSNVTNMKAMFYNNSKLTELNLDNFNTSSVLDMSYMFRDCSSIKELDLSHFNTSKVTTMQSMFYNDTNLTNVDLSSFDTKNVTSMAYMFYGDSSLEELDVTNFDTTNVTTMKSMFYNNSKLTTIDVSKFNTSNVQDMSFMFAGDSSLTEIDASNFNTSKVTAMQSMFYNCNQATNIDVSNFDTSNVTSKANMFEFCKKITTLDLSHFNTSKVTNMAFMFDECQSLTSIDVSNFDTKNVTTMQGMFCGLSKIKVLDLSSFNTAKVTNMKEMFNMIVQSHNQKSSALTTIYVSDKFTTAKVTESSQMFDAPKLVGGNGTKYNANYTNKAYAKIDKEGTKGYFTDIIVTSKYNVSFINDGVAYDTQEIKYNGVATKPTDPTKAGYTFKGWYLNDTEFDFNTKITKNIELTAEYEYNEPTIELVLDNSYFEGENYEINSNPQIDSNVGIKSIRYYYESDNSCKNLTNISELTPGTYKITVELVDNNDHLATDTKTVEIIEKSYTLNIVASNTTISKNSFTLKMNETISVDITPNNTFYFKSVLCTDGYSLVNTLSTGESANKKQTIQIRNNNKKDNGTCTFTMSSTHTLYDVSSVGEYVEYKPTSSTKIGNDIIPSSNTNWRILSKNSDGSIDIIPNDIVGTFNVKGMSKWGTYSSDQDRMSQSFINPTYSSSARGISPTDFDKIKDTNLTIQNNYAIKSNSAGTDFFNTTLWKIGIATGTTTESKNVHYESHSQNDSSSSDYEVTVGFRPIITLKAGVLEKTGNGTSNNPWILTDSY